jgi:hypothetical protein
MPQGDLFPGSTFDGVKVKDPAFLEKLNKVADLALRIEGMQVHGASFENTPSGISITIPKAVGGGGGGTASYFPVLVTKDGGADGTNSTAATWTYTVKDITGTDTLDTAVSPLMPKRPAVGKVTFAPNDSEGMARYDENDELVLVMVQEVPTAVECEAA